MASSLAGINPNDIQTEGYNLPQEALAASAGWWPPSTSQHPWLAGMQFHESDQLGRSKYISEIVTDLLENPTPDIKQLLDAHGCVPIRRLFSNSPSFAEKMFFNPTVPARAIMKVPQSQLGVDTERLTVWMLDTDERLCVVSEFYLQQKGIILPTPLEELLAHPEIQHILFQSAASSSEGNAENAERLRQALEATELMDVTEDSCGFFMVTMCAAEHVVCKTMEYYLRRDLRTIAMFKKEGEVALSWLMEQNEFQKAFDRSMVPASKEVRLEVLRSAVNSSEHYVLEASKMSLRRIESNKESRAPMKTPSVCSAIPPSNPVKRMPRSLRSLPTEKDAKHLRQLLGWYFEPFNLQHNRVLMSVVRAHRARRYLQAHGLQPVFTLEDLRGLPRIERILQQYEAEAAPWLLAAAMQTETALPVRICPIQGRGAWAASQGSTKLELTYIPDFRFIETVNDKRAEVQPLLIPEIDPYAPVQSLSGNAFSVLSYCLSSDLSHSQSPKRNAVLAKIIAAGLEPDVLQWSVRLPKIKRQLLQYGPDFMCLQCVQSIGHDEHCSEWDPDWFLQDDEPETNHIVHLFRELSKSNYGVAFAPTLSLPGSKILCFGNAVFYKHSRWKIEQQWNVPYGATCVGFTAKQNGLRTMICSCKTAATYAQDWGDEISSADLLEPALKVQIAVKEAAKLSGAAPVWCGDFGCEATALLPGLSMADRKHVWESACTSVLGENPAETTDLVLHDHGVEALAVLGGVHERAAVAEWFKAGYPSDHLLQLAVFTVGDVPVMNEEEWPQIGQLGQSSSCEGLHRECHWPAWKEPVKL